MSIVIYIRKKRRFLSPYYTTNSLLPTTEEGLGPEVTGNHQDSYIIRDLI
jgi:hypothetical protein